MFFMCRLHCGAWPHYRAEGLGWGRGGEAPREDIVLNITKYLKRHIVLPGPQLVGSLCKAAISS